MKFQFSPGTVYEYVMINKYLTDNGIAFNALFSSSLDLKYAIVYSLLELYCNGSQFVLFITCNRSW